MKLACLQVKAHDWKHVAQSWSDLKAKIVAAAREHDLVLVPECAYPAYFLCPFDRPQGDPDAEVEEEIRAIARTAQTYIAFGYAQGRENKAILVDPQGQVISEKSKSYLWHFDHRWFEPGEELALADTKFGRLALIICADGRMPELVRMAALEGAVMVLDLANLTATGLHMEALTNAQVEYMLRIRARENGVWLAVADKWGVESNCVTYAGRSAVYRPDGACVAKGPSDADTVLSVEIPTDERGQILRTHPSLPVRKPELYTLLTVETSKTPVRAQLEKPIVPDRTTPYVVVTCSVTPEWSTSERVLHVRRLLEQEADWILMPPMDGKIDNPGEFYAVLGPGQYLSLSDTVDGRMRTRLFTREGEIATYLTQHHASPTSELVPEVVFPVIVETVHGHIGFLHNDEMLIPEAVRCVMLAGADMLVWPHTMPLAEALPLARTRAAENRIFVAGLSGAPEAHQTDQGAEQNRASFLVDPSGSVLASTLTGTTIHASGALCPLSLARIKTIVPGTDALRGRRPDHYRRLVEQ